ncbi:MAG: hypothetical protein JRJ84_09050 [Deltaproteobacteria bacterium]|nr:hypothetical protein [Deltaproteobacteria bacterium]
MASRALRILCSSFGALGLLMLTTGGAPPRADVAEGTALRIWDISPEDAWYPHRARLIDTECEVGPGAVRPNDGVWFDGRVTCSDGLPYVFYQFTFQLLPAHGIVDSVAPPLAVPLPPDCAPGVFTGTGLGDGRRVKIVDIHPEDAYYDTRFSVIGLSGTVSGDLHNNEGCWFGGGFVADEGTDFYFYMASVAPVDEGPEPSDGRHSGSVVSAGAAVTILDIHPDDAYHGNRSEIIGKDCTATGQLDAMDPT